MQRRCADRAYLDQRHHTLLAESPSDPESGRVFFHYGTTIAKWRVVWQEWPSKWVRQRRFDCVQTGRIPHRTRHSGPSPPFSPRLTQVDLEPCLWRLIGIWALPDRDETRGRKTPLPSARISATSGKLKDQVWGAPLQMTPRALSNGQLILRSVHGPPSRMKCHSWAMPVGIACQLVEIT